MQVVQNTVAMEALYQGAMQACHYMVQDHRTAPATQHRRTTVLAHVIAWLSTMPHNRTMLLCTPVNMLVYLHAEFWGSTKAPTRQPGSWCVTHRPRLTGAVPFHLAMAYARMGRVGM